MDRDVRAYRDAAIVEAFALGMSMPLIGEQLGITRERVRQILSKHGLRGVDGGIQVRAAADREKRARELAERRDQRALRIYGCDFKTALRLNDGQRLRTLRCKADRFLNQKQHAQGMGYDWRLTFPEWCEVWRRSGKWKQRGLAADKYVMSRRDFSGPFSLENVVIETLRRSTQRVREQERAR